MPIPMNIMNVDEESYLLGGHANAASAAAESEQHPNGAITLDRQSPTSSTSTSSRSMPRPYHVNPATVIKRIRRLADFMGGLVVASAAFLFFHGGSSNASRHETSQTLVDAVAQAAAAAAQQQQQASPAPGLNDILNGGLREFEEFGAARLAPSALDAFNRYTYHQPYYTKPEHKSLQSKYKKFQALGFQIYTGTLFCPSSTFWTRCIRR